MSAPTPTDLSQARWSLAAAVGSGAPLPPETRVALASLVTRVGAHAIEHGNPDEVAAPCELCDVAADYRRAVAALAA